MEEEKYEQTGMHCYGKYKTIDLIASGYTLKEFWPKQQLLKVLSQEDVR